MGSIELVRDVPVPMRDGVILRADVFRAASGRSPVLLQRTPYGKESRLGTLTSLDPFTAAAAGYAVVIQDVRGRFGSEGEFQPFAQEAEDGYDSVEWAAAQDWSSGEVGMFGGSYMGATQWQAAITRPPHLRAICPIQASSDYFEGRSYRGGAFELGALLGISLNALAQGSIARVDPDGRRRRELWGESRAMLDDLARTCADLPLAKHRTSVLGELAPFFFEWLEHDEFDGYWRSMAVEGRYAEVGTPALHVSSWFDQFLVGTLRNYEGMRRDASPAVAEEQYLIVGPWNHYPPRTGTVGSARVGELTFGLDAIVNMDRIQLRWFDRHLRGDGPPPMRKRVRLFVMGANAWRDEDDWPLARASQFELYLGSDGRAGVGPGGTLSISGPRGERSDELVADPARPVPTCGGAHLLLETQFRQGPQDQRAVEAREDVLVYTTDPLEEELEVTGWVEARLWVSSSAPSADLTARLVVVLPDGRAVGLVDGLRRVALTSTGGPVKVSIDLGAVSFLFRRGEAIRLDVAGSNFPRFDLNLHTGARAASSADLRAARHTVHHERGFESVLIMPVVRAKATG